MFRRLLPLATLIVSLGFVQGDVWAQAPRATRSAAKPPVMGTININTASAAELEALPGVGAKTAALIVEYRQKNGAFKKIEELMNVRGVGEKNFLKLKAQISVSG